MPFVSKSGAGTTTIDLNPSAIACHFWFHLRDGSVAHGFIGSEKFNKHIHAVDREAIGTTKTQWLPWVVNRFKGPQTAIAPASFTTIRPLYQRFAEDFIAAFLPKHINEWNAELTYAEPELVGTLSHVRNVAQDMTKKFTFSKLRVGAITRYVPANQVPQSALVDRQTTGNLLVVYFQHGPLVEGLTELAK